MMAWIKEWVRQYVARVVRWTKISRSTRKGGFVGIEGRETDPQEPDYQHEGRLIQQYGLRSKPRPGSECIAVAIGGGASNRAIIATETPGTGPAEQQDDEVEIYAAPGQRIILDKDGQLTILAQGGQVKLDTAGKLTIDSDPGADVVVNGGAQKVARVGDTGDSGTLTTTSATVGTVTTVTLLYTPPGSVVTTVIGAWAIPLGAGTPGAASLSTTLTSGADRFKA